MNRNLLGRLYDPCLKIKLIPPGHCALRSTSEHCLSVCLSIHQSIYPFLYMSSFDYDTLKTLRQSLCLSSSAGKQLLTVNHQWRSLTPHLCVVTLPVIVLMKVYGILVYYTHIQVYGHIWNVCINSWGKWIASIKLSGSQICNFVA